MEKKIREIIDNFRKMEWITTLSDETDEEIKGRFNTVVSEIMKIVEPLLDTLSVIEAMCAEIGDMSDTPEMKVINDIYKFAHTVKKDKKCQHEDWDKDLKDTIKSFKKHGLI